MSCLTVIYTGPSAAPKHNDLEFLRAEEAESPPCAAEPWLPGRLQACLPFWKRITSDPEVLNLVEHGWSPEFGWCQQHRCFRARKRAPAYSRQGLLWCSRCDSKLNHIPPPRKIQPNKPEIDSPEFASFVDETLAKLLSRGVVRQASQKELHLVAPLGVARQKNKLRLFYACCHLNSHLLHRKFKIETMRREGRDAFTSKYPSSAFGYCIDILSAYHHVSIHPDAQKYLGFRDRHGNFFTFCQLPFGVGDAPRKFTIILRAPVNHWRSTIQARFVHVLDDISGAEDSKARADFVLDKITQDLTSLGFIIQSEKTVKGKQVFTSLGFKVDLLGQRFFLPEDRVQEIVDKSTRLLNLHSKSARNAHIVQALELVSLAGKVIGYELAIGCRARIFTRSLYATVYSQVNVSTASNLLRHIAIPDFAISALTFWANPTRWARRGCPIYSHHFCSPPEGFLASDASDIGSGALLTVNNAVSSDDNKLLLRFAKTHSLSLRDAKRLLSQGLEIADLLPQSMLNSSSTHREGFAVAQAFEKISHIAAGCHFHLRLDSQCLAFILGGVIPAYAADSSDVPTDLLEAQMMSHFPNMSGGSRIEELQDLAERIYNLSDAYNFTFISVWCPRRLNSEADYLSKSVAQDFSDYVIDISVLFFLERHWRTSFSLDVFASASSARCKRFFSRFYHPEATGVDAFNQIWTNEIVWLHPPPAIIHLTVEYARRQKARGVIIIPQWPRHSFYQLFVGRNDRLPTPASRGGPAFIQDTFRLGSASSILSFPHTPPPLAKLPSGILWAILVDFHND